MCGICGLVGQGDEAVLARMMRRLEHRGPDENGVHQEAGIRLGTQRLRVIDPQGGHQPISNETGTVWVVMNGEIYNYRELRRELIDKGHRFTTNCDTEVLVHLYEQEGEAGVQRLRGMFAYALWDRERRRLLLVRDRLGIKPLYYALVPGAEGGGPGLAFASELPSLLEALPSRSVDPSAVAQYLTLLYVPGPGTMYEGVRQLPPGEWLKVEGGKIETGRYYHPSEALRPSAAQSARASLAHRRESEPETEERFLALLKDTVRAHLVSDVPLGLFLSGGLDSGAILAMMRSVTNGPIKSFSIGYGAPADRSYNELDAARLMADHFGAEHTEERLTPDVVTLLPKIVAAMGEPFADSSAIPTYLVSAVARRSVTVALSGIGGDELFGGYPRYLGVRAAARYALVPAIVRGWVGAWVAPLLREGEGSRDQLGRLKRFLRDGRLDLSAQYVRWITFLPAEWGDSAFTPVCLAGRGPELVAQAYRERFDRWPADAPSDRAMGLDLQTYLPDDLLRMGDRLSMAHSLELRVPFCDHELLAFACSLPPSVRFDGWTLKGFMRKALGRFLPPAILNAPKRGFQVPIARWLREDLREMVRDLLSDETVRRRGYVKPEYVRWLLREHDAGRRNFADQIYAMVVLELWHRRCG
ncbi:MAG: asparagine synthase (glutamine-hydrolyzing) [Nitrospirae bacterium]|nr:MAG: asparagine synthase (glutamine-hydrolyzing) [Nitrospirota bacterium]